MTKLWYIVNVRSGRELFLHELFLKAGFDVYTPFLVEVKHQRSRKARKERLPAREIAKALWPSYLLVGSQKPVGDALLGIGYIIQERDDAYSFMVDGNIPVTLSEAAMKIHRLKMRQDLSGKKRVVLRGYDPKRDARKNQNRLYGRDIITLPNFTPKERVEFVTGGFEGLGAQVTSVSDDFITVMTKIFGQDREMKVDPYELRKVG